MGIGATLLASYALLEAVSWRTGDAITRAHIETKWLLRSHLLLDRSEAVRAWLAKYHGEGPGSEVMNVFVAWSISNPDRAELLLSELPGADWASTARRIGWAASDSGQAEQFLALFGDSSSPVMQIAVHEVVRFSQSSGDNDS